METITADKLKQIRDGWKMTQSAFASLLNANLRTYQDWEQGRSPVPTTVAAHVKTIQKLRIIYTSWNHLATPLAGTEEFDEAVDNHEKLWDECFPCLDRL